MKSSIEKLPKSEVKISITVPADDFEKYHARGLKKIQEMVAIDGFRKGSAPEEIIVKNYGEMIILEEMANLCLADAYPEALKEHKVLPLVEPQVMITKLAKGNPFEASITIATLPEVKLADYKKIAKENAKDSDNEKGEEIADTEVDEVLKELQKGRATSTHTHDHEGHDHHDHDHAHEGHDHNHDHSHDEKKEDAPLPELNDEFAKSFGDEFKSLDDLKNKVRTNLVLEKKQKASDKRRTAIMEKVVAESSAELSDVIVESELNRMVAQMKGDIGRFGGTWEDYLKHAQKTESDLRSDWRKDAERRALSQLVLNEISKKENLKPTEEEIDVELIRIKASFPDADESRARDYLYQALMNEKVLKYLEETK